MNMCVEKRWIDVDRRKPRFGLPGLDTGEHTTFPHATSLSRDISVGIATLYGPGGPGIESFWRQDFPQPSGLALGPNPASYKMGTGSFPGVKRPGRGVVYPPHLAPRLRKE